MVRGVAGSLLLVLWSAHGVALAAPEPGITYKCPGNTYTNLINAQEAKAKGCTTIEGTPITIVQTPKPKPVASAPRTGGSERDKGEKSEKISPTAQRERDNDARRILEAELKREEDALNQLLKEFNDGEPERQGDERNFSKYQDRVAGMKASIARKESDIAAIRRELAKLPPPQ